MKPPSSTPVRGLVAAPFTPFRPDGTPALDLIAPVARSLARNDVTAAFICGTTGEGVSLTTEERKSIAEEWMRAAPQSLAVMVHIGHLSLGDAQELGRHAQKIGAAATATIAPSFFKPRNAAGLAKWCADAAKGAPDLPFYYYHMPAMTGVNISAEDFLVAAHGLIPNLAGIKFTHENLMDYSRCAAFADRRYDMLFGRDEILLAGMSLGARGAVGSTYNFAAPLYRRVIKAFEAGNLAAARREQLKAMEFIAVLNRFGGLCAGKATMKLIGLDCGPTRPPLETLSPADVKKLESELKRIGFFDYASKA